MNGPKIETNDIKNIRDGWKSIVGKMMAIQSFYLRSLNISRPAFFILHHLESQGSESLVRLSHIIQVSKSTITSISDNLERGNLVRRIKNEKDRRSYYLAIEPKGKELLRKISDLYDDLIKALIENLGERELEILEKAMIIMKENLERMEMELTEEE